VAFGEWQTDLANFGEFHLTAYGQSLRQNVGEIEWQAAFRFCAPSKELPAHIIRQKHSAPMKFALYCMFVLRSSDRRQCEFTTYLGPLKKLLPKIHAQTRMPKTAKICAA